MPQTLVKVKQETEADQLKRAFVKVMLTVAKQIPQTPTKDLIASVALAIPHLELLSREMLDDIPNPNENFNLGWAFTGIARFYQGQGRYTLAEEPLQRCLSSVQEVLGSDHSDTATSLNNLALLYESMGRYTNAEPLYERSLHIYETQLGADHPLTATSLNNLALLYQTRGRYSDAEPLRRRSLHIRETQLGADHPDTASSLNNLALLYYAIGRYSDAEPLYLRALEIWTKSLGENHPHTQTAWGNFRHLLQQALASRRADSLSSHPLTQQLLQEMRE